MGGELYRYLRLRKRVPTEQEQLTYALLLPRFRELFERKLVNDENGAFGSALRSYRAYVESRRRPAELKPTRLLVSADGAVPILLESRRTDADAGFAKLPSLLVELILDFAYVALEAGRSVHLHAECSRPYAEGALVIPKHLADDFEIGWQDVSYSRAPDPLRDFADEVMDALLGALPHVFEQHEEDAWADDMRFDSVEL